MLTIRMASERNAASPLTGRIAAQSSTSHAASDAGQKATQNEMQRRREDSLVVCRSPGSVRQHPSFGAQQADRMTLAGSTSKFLIGEQKGPQERPLRSFCGPACREQPGTRENSRPRGPVFSRDFPPVPGCSHFQRKSGRQDLNLRPPGPQPGALPDCATPRGKTKRATGIEPALEAWKASVQPQHFARTPWIPMLPASSPPRLGARRGLTLSPLSLTPAAPPPAPRPPRPPARAAAMGRTSCHAPRPASLSSR